MKRWWIVGVSLTVLMWLQPCLVQSQMTNWETWELSGVIWCGDPEVWIVDSSSVSMPVHRMHAASAGTQILWGCPTLSSEGGASSWRALTFWEQALHGSNANQSAVMWAAPPDTSATTSAEILALSHQSGWLDETGGFAAGSNGSADPLDTHAPLMAAWQLSEGCHTWAEPFAFTSLWDWEHDGLWKVNSWDDSGRSQAWVDTLTPLVNDRLPCLGLQVKHTSSNGDRWAFGWTPAEGSMDTLMLLGPEATSFELVSPHVLEGLLGHQDLDANLELDAALACDGVEEALPSLLPEHAQCDNVWQWQLPCSVSAGQSIVIEWHDVVDTLWRDGSGLLTRGHAAFTEIMADPTPAMHAPESTFLEVLNTSSLAFDPTALLLVDSEDTLSLEWVRRADCEVVIPGDHFIIADVAAPWADFTSAAVTRAVGWSGLRDEGESLQLLGPDLQVLEDLVFFDNWWGSASQDGQSLSCRSPSSCDDPANWWPDPWGASPGKATTLPFQSSSWNQPGVSLRRTPNETLTLQPVAPWDPRQVVSGTLTSATSTTSTSMVHAWNEEGKSLWTCPIPEGAIGPFQVTIYMPTSCVVNLELADIDTLWAGHRAPEMGDLVLTEILPSTHPVLQCEFVEWTNVSDDTLDWKGCPWEPGTCLVQASHSSDHVQTWMGPSWFRGHEDMLWEVLPHFSLTNDEGEVSIDDEWGNRLASVAYSQCGHTSSSGSNQGRSMECLPVPFLPAHSGPEAHLPAWRTCPTDCGMSPGHAEKWEPLSEEDDGPPQVSWGVLEGSWVMTVPNHAQAQWWAKEMWNPATVWTSFWHRGVLMMRADHGPSVQDMGPVSIQHPELSFPEVPWHNEASPYEAPHWNEVLLEPHEGHASFLEWKTLDDPIWSGQWHWSSHPNPNPEDFVPVSDVDWLLAPQGHPCFASCPNWVDAREPACLSANVPSLHGERVLTLKSHDQASSLDLALEEPSAWVLKDEGRSMARIPETDVWTSTPPPLWATPGKPNGPANHAATRVGFNRMLECTPSIQPGGDDAWDVALMTWTPPVGEDLYHLRYGVLDPMRNLPLQAFEAMWSTAPLQWTWKGTDDNNLLVNPGPYVAVVQWVQDATGLRGMDRCLVAVAPTR